MSKVIDIVNERIMKELEAGVIPWQKPWTGVRNGAYSRSTGKPYSLINQMLLGKPGEYLTVKQIMEAGGKLLPDQKSSIVVFWKQNQRKVKGADGDEVVRSFPVLRFYKVYHISQCEGIEPMYSPEALENMKSFDADEEAERLSQSYLDRSGCTLEHVKQNRAFYVPAYDSITLPLREQFKSVAGYYSTKFHEIGHSTGHSSRLNRFETDGYNHEAYSREELVAELVSASMLNLCGLETSGTIRDAAAYIGSWLRALKVDRRMLMWAATRAEKALKIITEEVEIAAAQAEEDIFIEEEDAAPVSEPAPTVAAITASMKKAALAFAKSCVVKMKERPNLAGAFEYEGHQYITDGFVMVSYETPIGGLPQANLEKGNAGENFQQTINAARLGVSLPLPALSELSKQFKDAKAKSKNKEYKQYTKLGRAFYFNSEYLMTAMALAGVGDNGSARMQNNNRAMYIEGVGCEVIILPVRVQGNPAEDVWQPKLTA